MPRLYAALAWIGAVLWLVVLAVFWIAVVLIAVVVVIVVVVLGVCGALTRVEYATRPPREWRR